MAVEGCELLVSLVGISYRRVFMIWQRQWIFMLGVLAIIGIISTLAAFSRRMFKKNGGEKESFVLTSSAFENDASMPSFYTCDGHDVSPPLAWQHAPAGTKSFVLIFHDPDALGGDWIHWIVYDIPPQIVKFEEHTVVASIGAKTGLNSWDNDTYGGPCPPLKEHRYIFTLYALDIPHLEVKPPVNEKAVMQAMEGHILDKAMLTGTYQRIKSI